MLLFLLQIELKYQIKTLCFLLWILIAWDMFEDILRNTHVTAQHALYKCFNTRKCLFWLLLLLNESFIEHFEFSHYNGF